MQALSRWSFILFGAIILNRVVKAEIFENKTEWTRKENTEISRRNTTVNNDAVFAEETKMDPGEYSVPSSGQEKLLETNWTGAENPEISEKIQHPEISADKMYVTNFPEEPEDFKAEESSVFAADKWVEPVINWTTNKNLRNTKKSSSVKFPIDKVLVTNYSEGSNADDEELSSEGISSASSSGISSASSSGISSATSSATSSGISSASSGPSKNTKKSAEFKPSVHLGEITQEQTGSPFNQLRHFEFQGTLESLRLPQSGTKIKFQDDLTNSYSVSENAHFPTADQNYPNISPSALEKPLQTDFQSTGSFPGSNTNSFGYHVPYGSVPHQGNVFENVEKPAAPLVYLSEQESTFTRTRKFPYQFYRPYVGYGDAEYLEEPHPVVHYPRPRSISPWKKIIHLIGAFLPLGLLIAALTPNVVKVDNATQPNIVLSKLRVVDLPAEHKQDDRPANHSCEDRSICEIILASRDSSTQLLQTVLWNLAVRTPEETAMKNGLREIFQAVKKKDCNLIECMN